MPDLGMVMPQKIVCYNGGMADKINKHVTAKLAELVGERYCSNCATQRPKEGGVWQTYNNGLNRRWKCAQCVQNAKNRQS